MIRGEDGRIARVCYVLPRHKVANWVGPGRERKSTRPGGNGFVKISPFDFLDRLSDLMPPRKHRHRYHGVFPRITSAGQPSRRWPSVTLASGARPRMTDMHTAGL